MSGHGRTHIADVNAHTSVERCDNATGWIAIVMRKTDAPGAVSIADVDGYELRLDAVDRQRLIVALGGVTKEPA